MRNHIYDHLSAPLQHINHGVFFFFCCLRSLFASIEAIQKWWFVWCWLAFVSTQTTHNIIIIIFFSTWYDSMTVCTFLVFSLSFSLASMPCRTEFNDFIVISGNRRMELFFFYFHVFSLKETTTSTTGDRNSKMCGEHANSMRRTAFYLSMYKNSKWISIVTRNYYLTMQANTIIWKFKFQVSLLRIDHMCLLNIEHPNTGRPIPWKNGVLFPRHWSQEFRQHQKKKKNYSHK